MNLKTQMPFPLSRARTFPLWTIPPDTSPDNSPSQLGQCPVPLKTQHIYIHVCTHACIHIYIYAYSHRCMHTRIYAYNTYMHTYMYSCIHIHLNTVIYIDIFWHNYTYMYTYIHTYIHSILAYIHTDV